MTVAQPAELRRNKPLSLESSSCEVQSLRRCSSAAWHGVWLVSSVDNDSFFPCLQFMLVGNTKGAMSNALGKVGSVVKGAKAMAQAKLEQTRVRCLRSVARCLQAMHPYLSHLHAHVEGSTRHRLHASLAYFACDCAVDGRVFPHTALHLVISFMRHARGAFQNLMAT